MFVTNFGASLLFFDVPVKEINVAWIGNVPKAETINPVGEYPMNYQSLSVLLI